LKRPGRKAVLVAAFAVAVIAVAAAVVFIVLPRTGDPFSGTWHTTDARDGDLTIAIRQQDGRYQVALGGGETGSGWLDAQRSGYTLTADLAQSALFQNPNATPVPGASSETTVKIRYALLGGQLHMTMGDVHHDYVLERGADATAAPVAPSTPTAVGSPMPSAPSVQP
jgi:hypothetical protein